MRNTNAGKDLNRRNCTQRPAARTDNFAENELHVRLPTMDVSMKLEAGFVVCVVFRTKLTTLRVRVQFDNWTKAFTRGNKASIFPLPLLERRPAFVELPPSLTSAVLRRWRGRAAIYGAGWHSPRLHRVLGMGIGPHARRLRIRARPHERHI